MGEEEEEGLDSDGEGDSEEHQMGKAAAVDDSDGDDEAEEENGRDICEVPTVAEIDKMGQKELREQLRQRSLVMGGAKPSQRARLLKALGHTVTAHWVFSHLVSLSLSLWIKH
jgi:hypothetical protein